MSFLKANLVEIGRDRIVVRGTIHSLECGKFRVSVVAFIVVNDRVIAIECVYAADDMVGVKAVVQVQVESLELAHERIFFDAWWDDQEGFEEVKVRVGMDQSYRKGSLVDWRFLQALAAACVQLQLHREGGGFARRDDPFKLDSAPFSPAEITLLRKRIPVFWSIKLTSASSYLVLSSTPRLVWGRF